MARKGRIGFYKFKAEYQKFSQVIQEKNGTTYPVSKFDFVDTIRYKHNNGEGLNKEELKITQNFLVESGKQVIETVDDNNYSKGDKIIIDGSENIIDRIMQKRSENKQLRGNSKLSKDIKYILFIG